MTGRKKQGSNPELRELAGALGLVAQLGFLMLGSIGAGFLIGFLLDKKFGGGGLFLAIFLPIGIVAGFIQCYRLIRKLGIWSGDGS
jgi:F0F1-type ATP synthase assembly protein I